MVSLSLSITTLAYTSLCASLLPFPSFSLQSLLFLLSPISLLPGEYPWKEWLFTLSLKDPRQCRVYSSRKWRKISPEPVATAPSADKKGPLESNIRHLTTWEWRTLSSLFSQVLPVVGANRKPSILQCHSSASPAILSPSHLLVSISMYTGL